jgi:addiction module HigA family antidote
MKMHNPPHPGEVLKELCIEPLNLTVTETAEALGVSRKTMSAILNGKAGISPEMAIRLSKAFDTSPESWLNQQMQYDLWQAEQTIGNYRSQAFICGLTWHCLTRRRNRWSGDRWVPEKTLPSVSIAMGITLPRLKRWG